MNKYEEHNNLIEQCSTLLFSCKQDFEKNLQLFLNANRSTIMSLSNNNTGLCYFKIKQGGKLIIPNELSYCCIQFMH